MKQILYAEDGAGVCFMLLKTSESKPLPKLGACDAQHRARTSLETKTKKWLAAAEQGMAAACTNECHRLRGTARTTTQYGMICAVLLSTAVGLSKKLK